MATHRLDASPETVHWGYFDAALKPLLTIESGDTVTISSVSGVLNHLPKPESGLTIPPELAAIHQKVQPRLGENPNVVVYYRNPARKENPYRAGCIRFHGKARLVTSGPERDKAWDLTNHEEQSKDPDKKGAAVIIDLDLVEQIDSTVIMKRD